MSSAPDYKAVLKLLSILRNWVDATREVTLTAQEASQIRSLGFPTAREGRWKVPPFPYKLVADTYWEFLSIGWDTVHACNPGLADAPLIPSQAQLAQVQVSSEPAAGDPRTEPLASEKASDTDQDRESDEGRRAVVEMVGGKIRRALEKAGGRIPRRRLQQKFWRFGREIFYAALRELDDRGIVALENGLVVLRKPVTRVSSVAGEPDQKRAVSTDSAGTRAAITPDSSNTSRPMQPRS